MDEGFYLQKFTKGSIVAPEKAHIEKLTAALRFFGYHDPDMWNKFRSMNAILVYPGEGYEKEFGLWEKERIWVTDAKSVMNSAVFYLASDLVHETQHLIQHDRGSKDYGDIDEKEAYEKQREFLLKYGDKESVEWLDNGFKKKWWLWMTPDGKESLHFPASKPLKEFVEDYINGKLKIKEVLNGNVFSPIKN